MDNEVTSTEESTSVGEALNEVNSPAPKEGAVIETPVVEAKVETPEVVAPKEEPAQKQVPLSVAIAERRKRQELEQELATLRAQQTESVQQPYVDPDTQTVIQSTVQQMGSQWENRHVSMSEIIAKQAHPDYAEKYAAFEQVAASNPELLSQIINSDAPGEAAYQAGKRILFEKEYGSDEESILKKVEAKLRPRLQKEIEEQVFGKLKDRNKQPTSTSHVRSASGDSVPEFRPTTFADLLGK